MTEVSRTLILSAPEAWEVLSDPALMSAWAGELAGAGGPVEIRVDERRPECRLAWSAGPVRLEATLEEAGFGTRVTVSSEHAPHPGAEEAIGRLLDRAVEDIARPRRRPFSAV